MKKRGSLLIVTIVWVIFFILLSIPILYFLRILENNSSSEALEDRADEVAYAGYKFMEKYIVDNEEKFINMLDENKENVTVLYVPYGDGSQKTDVSITSSVVLNEHNLIDEVTIHATCSYSDTMGSYKDTIYIESSSTSSETTELGIKPSVFPYDKYSLEDDTKATSEEGPTLMERMDVTEIPEIDAEHIEYVKNHENSNVVTVGTSNIGVVYWNDIQNALDELGQSEEGKSKPWQVIYVDNQTNRHTTVRTDNRNDMTGGGYYKIPLENRIKTIDMTGFGNGEDRTSLIFLSDRDILFAPYWNTTVTNSVYTEEDFQKFFPDAPVYGVYGNSTNLVNCDLYFISYRGSGQATISDNGYNAGVHSPDNRSYDNLGQITFASGNKTGQSKVKRPYAYIGRSVNTFFYFPFLEFNIDAGGEIDYFTTFREDTRVLARYAYPFKKEYKDVEIAINHDISYGGVVATNTIMPGGISEEDYISVEWKGDPRLLGYYNYDANYNIVKD